MCGGQGVSLRRLRSSGSPDAVFENERTERRCEPLPVLRTEIQVRPEALMGLRCRLESFIVFVFVDTQTCHREGSTDGSLFCIHGKCSYGILSFHR